MWCFFLLAPDDYLALSQNITLDSGTPSKHLMISINDDMFSENEEEFEIILTSLNDNCAISSSPVPVLIIDNDGVLPVYDGCTMLVMCLMHTACASQL